MPSVSRNERITAAIAEHHPEQLNPENRGMLKMSKQQLHDYAATPEKGLSKRVPSRKRRYYGEK